MDETTPPNLPTETPEQPSPQTKQERTQYGAIAGIVIIVLILALGGYYIWATQIRNGSVGPETENPADSDEALTELESQSNSDSLSTIEGDLEGTDIDAIDRDLAEIEAELEAEGY
jgi:uncharacterized protein HemX